MARQRVWLTGLICVAGLVCANGEVARAQAPTRTPPAATDKMDRVKAAASVPLQEVTEHYREGVKITLEKPALYTQGPVETFACAPHVYYWLLEHPDRGVVAWRRLGAQCVMIVDRGAGRFGWTDEHGSDLQWETVYHSSDKHIWYAEGKVRPAPMLPLVPVKAVVVLRYSEQTGPNGVKMMQHQADMFLHTDSAGAALATKLLGAAAPKMAEQCVTQMQMFFAGMAWYVHRFPDQAATLLMVPAESPPGVQSPGHN
jgi:hypothetical protein